MRGQIATITKEQITGHMIQIASQITENGVKLMTYVIGGGYGVSYTKGKEEGQFGATDSVEMAIATYNSIKL